MMMAGESMVLPADRTACALARSWSAERLAPLGLDQALQEDIVLCIDELVANVISHTSSSPVLTIRVHDGVHVEVADTSGVPAAMRPPSDGLPGGWGLRIVDRVADRWGCVPKAGGGKIVWFAVAT
jgi:anti-sigma regulatory factor (Ser/Thr protein kinase)